jgi:hypothetical protein
MSQANQHRFHVHPCESRGEGHMVPDAATPHEAALAFLEHWAPANDGEVSVIVKDCETGRQECFRLDVDSGDVAPCS